MTVGHFKDRFADQRWLIYDMKRRYGFYYDLHTVEEVTFDDDGQAAHLITGMLDESLMDKDEKLFQQLWKTYFKSITIKERLNPRKHKQDMPVRYWKYITENRNNLIQFVLLSLQEILVLKIANVLRHCSVWI